MTLVLEYRASAATAIAKVFNGKLTASQYSANQPFATADLSNVGGMSGTIDIGFTALPTAPFKTQFTNLVSHEHQQATLVTPKPGGRLVSRLAGAHSWH